MSDYILADDVRALRDAWYAKGVKNKSMVWLDRAADLTRLIQSAQDVPDYCGDVRREYLEDPTFHAKVETLREMGLRGLPIAQDVPRDEVVTLLGMTERWIRAEVLEELRERWTIRQNPGGRWHHNNALPEFVADLDSILQSAQDVPSFPCVCGHALHRGRCAECDCLSPEAAQDVPRDEELGRCEICLHRWTQHDPEDGRCDSHRSDGGLGVCPCGRALPWMNTRMASNSRAALTSTPPSQDVPRDEVEALHRIVALAPDPDDFKTLRGFAESYRSWLLRLAASLPVQSAQDVPRDEVVEALRPLAGAWEKIRGGQITPEGRADALDYDLHHNTSPEPFPVNLTAHELAMIHIALTSTQSREEGDG